ncbi:zinc-finger homeodomain protein 4-like [Wolffia australiana]
MELSCHEESMPGGFAVLHEPPPLGGEKTGQAVKYRECLKNHAAAIGGNAVDGCGEFMPSGEEGSLEALKCAACGCHRNFHRKEIDGEFAGEMYPFYRNLKGRRLLGHKGLAFSPGHHAMIMPLGALQTSESEEMERAMPSKKRFRTKFTAEQKQRMLEFAERAGWRLQKEDEASVQQFCQEIGVKRRVLKVWMHNNKHSLAKKEPLQLQ